MELEDLIRHEVDALLGRCDAYCEQSQMSPARLSTIIFGSGVTIRRLREGRGVTPRVLKRASAALADRERRLAEPAQVAAA